MENIKKEIILRLVRLLLAEVRITFCDHPSLKVWKDSSKKIKQKKQRK